jgi:DNA processing protein
LQTVDVLILHRIKGIGNKSQLILIRYFNDHHLSSLDDLLCLDLSQTSIPKRPVKILNNFKENNLYESAKLKCENDIEQWRSEGITIITFGSKKYPIQLESLDDPPVLLFCKGNLNLLSVLKSITVIGTRENTIIGERITCKTVEYFSHLGFCIVSGLALGIDAIAHRAAMVNDGSTIAVLVDLINVFPLSNRDLADQIVKKNGLLISENSPGTRVVPGLFVKRDRIQAGLGMAVFAIETAVDGGTMHAVSTANSIGRNVFVPNAEAAGYSVMEIKAISGTQYLVSEGQASSYTRDSYDKIAHSLKQLVELFEDRVVNESDLL